MKRIENHEILAELESTQIYRSYRVRTRDATHPDRTAVAKVLLPALYHDEEIRTHFLEGAQAAAGLNHPSIVRVVDVRDTGELIYRLEEEADAGPLAVLLDEMHKPASLDELISIIQQLAAAIDYAHHNGVRHLNLTPASVLVTDYNRLLITDFGLPRLPVTQSATEDPQYRQMPTPYTAPELLDEEPQPCNETDVYGLGAICYHLMTGQPPFAASAPDILTAQIRTVEPDLPSTLNRALPSGLGYVLMGAMAKAPQNRYHSTRELSESIIEGSVIWHSGESAQTREMAPIQLGQSRMTGRRTTTGMLRRRWPVLTLLLLFAFICSGVWFLSSSGRTGDDGLAGILQLPAPIAARLGMAPAAADPTAAATPIVALAATSTPQADSATPTNGTEFASPAENAGAAADATTPDSGSDGERTGAALSTPASVSITTTTVTAVAPAIEPSTSTVDGVASSAAGTPAETQGEDERGPAPTTIAAPETTLILRPTSVPTRTPTPAPPATDTPEATHTATSAPTATATAAPTHTATPMPTRTPTPAPTATDTPEPTHTATSAPTATATAAPTHTATPLPTRTPTPVATNTPQATESATPPPTATLRATTTTAPTHTPTATSTARPVTGTGTAEDGDGSARAAAGVAATPAAGATASVAGTVPAATSATTTSPEPTPTVEPSRAGRGAVLLPTPPLQSEADGDAPATSSAAPTDTLTATTATPTATATATNTPLPTPTATSTPLPTNTPTATPATTATPTATSTATATNTPLPTPTATSTPLPTNTPTSTPTTTATPTATATNTPLPTPTATSTPLPTNTPTSTPSTTASPTATATATNTPLPTPTATSTPLPTNTPTATPTTTATPTATSTATATNTPLPTPTATNTPLPTNTPTITPTSTTVPAEEGILDLEIAEEENAIVLSGRARARDRIDILIDGSVVAGTVAGPDGLWQVIMPFAGPGAYSFVVQSIGLDGMSGATLDPAAIVVDPTAAEPVTLVFGPLPATTPAAESVMAAQVPATDGKNRAENDATQDAGPPATRARTDQDAAAAPTAVSTMAPPVTPIATATPAATEAPTATASPTPPARATRAPRATATPRPQQQAQARRNAPAVRTGSVKLLTPEDGISDSGRRTFRWVSDFTPSPGTAYELVFWPRNGDPMRDGFGLAAPTLLSEESVDLNALDHTLGNLLQPGQYHWGVLLVQTNPYRRIAFLGDAHAFYFDRTYGDGKPNVEDPGE